jgi:hypothetical protein
MEEKSLDPNPFTWSTLTTKLTLLPGCKAVPIGEDALVEVVDPLDFLTGTVTFATLTSTRHDPIASEVYRQNMGTVEVAESLLESGANEINAFPIKEYAGAGSS